MSTMPIDPRWLTIARECLTELGLSGDDVTRYTRMCAERLAAVAEDFLGDIEDAERAREDAAYDQHVNHLIDVARGK